MVLNGVFRMGRGVNGVRTYGTQSENFAFFYFCVILYENPVTKLCSFGFWTFGTLRTGGRSPRGSQSASPQPLPQKAPRNFKKFQEISRKSFASRRSLTAKSCRPIGNKKKPSMHAPTRKIYVWRRRRDGGGGGARMFGGGGETAAATSTTPATTTPAGDRRAPRRRKRATQGGQQWV
jgi:hypothetical protein